jgi:hypothetical protein
MAKCGRLCVMLKIRINYLQTDSTQDAKNCDNNDGKSRIRSTNSNVVYIADYMLFLLK